MTTALSMEAARALQQLEHGAVMNPIHTTARELIEAGLAIDGWGVLEITEQGRRVARTLRSFTADDPNIAELGARHERFDTPINSHEPYKLPPIAPGHGHDAPEPEPAPIEREVDQAGNLLWSRDRARRAAGVANGKAGTWVEPAWVDAFLEAYEAD